MADFPKDSSLGVSIDILKTTTLKTHIHPNNVGGRPTLKDVGSSFVNNIIYRMLYFMKTVLQRFMSCTLVSHPNAHAVRGLPTLNDVERYRDG